jgi:hypothetical protein
MTRPAPLASAMFVRVQATDQGREAIALHGATLTRAFRREKYCALGQELISF